MGCQLPPSRFSDFLDRRLYRGYIINMATTTRKPGRPSTGRPRLESLTHIKSTARWAGWVVSAARRAGFGSVSDLLEHGVRLVARQEGLGEPPSRKGD